MKTIKIFAALFIALVAMSSCSTADNPVESDPKAVKAELFGTWYAQYDATGSINGKTYQRVVEYYQFPEELGESNLGVWNRYYFAEAGDENPIDDLGGGSGATGLFDYTAGSDGNISLQLNNLGLAVYSLSYYDPTMRTLRYVDEHLTATGVDGRQVVFTKANGATEDMMYEWHVHLHGGYGEGDGSYGTGISDKDADGPSRARQH
jgi:hypothetical protein